MAMESPWKDLSIDTSHVSKRLLLAKILGRSTGNHHGTCKGDWSRRLQEIPQLIIVNEILLQPTSRRFLRELDEAPGGNNLHYILQCLCVPALVTRVWTRKVCQVATECSWNDGSETQYYYVILDRLLGRSRGLERAPEWRVRGPLTVLFIKSPISRKLP